jgi:hypothetical protein
MAVTFARLYSMLMAADRNSTDGKAIARATQQQIGNATHDVLAWYATQLVLGEAETDTPSQKLIALIAILLGLGMRESSGQFCAGADTPEDRGTPTTPENAEAGLFQVSYDSINGDALRQGIFDKYRGRTDLQTVFSAGVSCGAKDWKNYGSGDAAEFQNTMKRCPLFATLYSAVFLREHRQEWGPINSHTAEVKKEAVSLFRDIQNNLDRRNSVIARG